MFNKDRIENLESSFYEHVREFHRWKENDNVCYTKKDILTGKEIVSVAKILKIIPLQSWTIGSSMADLVIEDIVDNSVCKIGANDAYRKREFAQLKADIVNMKMDIAKIKQYLNKDN